MRDSKMVQVVAEEVIMAVAHWLTAVVNRSLQPKPAPQTKVQEQPVVNNASETEQLLLKLSTLVERLYERDQAMAALEKRINSIEQYLGEKGALGQHMKDSRQAIATLESRLDCVETLTQQITPSLEKAELNTQLITVLENRTKLVESLLVRFRVVPRSVGGNSQAIALLKNRVEALEAAQDLNPENSHKNVPVAKVF
ncbi:hypothetical protein [Trichocoleus sp. FACHB-262]|uniref:hypothetical protein n=1 Tax=Trichocoleus sp. FACHB-262 TaxID=2692869 RepID=UPI001683E348|nr:hypothetical protein [Trichocoleus sp. FACHB-262]MBD2123798.1 hypothetical protein [Trichocoleus sp. FACHB-262]